MFTYICWYFILFWKIRLEVLWRGRWRNRNLTHHYEKKEEIWLSFNTKAPLQTEKSNRQSGNTKTPPKTSITQRLRTDLGLSVGITTVIQLLWLNRFAGRPTFPLPQNCSIKRTQIEKLVNNPPFIDRGQKTCQSGEVSMSKLNSYFNK